MNTDKVTFLYEKPEDDPALNHPLNVIIAMGALASRLTREERTRTIHPDGRRENVAEHAYMLAKVSLVLVDILYPSLDRARIAIYALNHDDVEAYVGDTPTDSIANHNPEIKQFRERAGLTQLVQEYRDVSPAYTAAMASYEAQEDLEAQFVRIVDKMMVSLIHIPNEGKILREFYTHKQYVAQIVEGERKLLEQYPHLKELIAMRSELALYVGRKYMVDWKEIPAS